MFRDSTECSVLQSRVGVLPSASHAEDVTIIVAADGTSNGETSGVALEVIDLTITQPTTPTGDPAVTTPDINLTGVLRAPSQVDEADTVIDLTRDD